MIVAGTVAAIVALTSAALAWQNWEESDRTIEVESWETKHPGLYYELRFEAEETGDDVIVKVTDADMEFQVLNGRQPFWGAGSHTSPDQRETDDPPCSQQCWQGYAYVKAKSEPGLVSTFPYTSWVNWDFRPGMSAGGESTIKFTAHMPSDGTGTGCPSGNPNCGDIAKWTPYGKWTLEVAPFTLTHKATLWGSGWQHKEEPSIFEVFQVKKG